MVLIREVKIPTLLKTEVWGTRRMHNSGAMEILLCELRLPHLQPNDQPYGPPSVTLNEFCRRVVADIPSNDKDNLFFRSLADSLD
jgi:hypothetical protein